MKSTYLQSTAKEDQSGIVFLFSTHTCLFVLLRNPFVLGWHQHRNTGPATVLGKQTVCQSRQLHTTLAFLEFSGQTEKVKVVV